MRRTPKLRLALIPTLLLAAALGAPAAAQAHSSHHKVVRARLTLPINFTDPTPACPQGIAAYGLKSHGKAGHGMNCLQNPVPFDCPSGSAAFLCQSVPVHTTLRLRGGRIRARHMTIREIWTCADPACNTISIRQRWRGRVTRATGRFDDLAGGSVSGGGTAVVDASTFAFLSIHEVLVIRAHHDDR
jgi:hypothetical protein